MAKPTLIATTVLMLVGFSMGTLTAAHAVTMPAANPAITISDPNIQPAKTVIVKKKKGHKTKVWVYSNKYGHRYRHKRHGYVYYYYGGYWYPRPWWTICIGC